MSATKETRAQVLIFARLAILASKIAAALRSDSGVGSTRENIAALTAAAEVWSMQADDSAEAWDSMPPAYLSIMHKHVNSVYAAWQQDGKPDVGPMDMINAHDHCLAEITKSLGKGGNSTADIAVLAACAAYASEASAYEAFRAHRDENGPFNGKESHAAYPQNRAHALAEKAAYAAAIAVAELAPDAMFGGNPTGE